MVTHLWPFCPRRVAWMDPNRFNLPFLPLHRRRFHRIGFFQSNGKRNGSSGINQKNRYSWNKNIWLGLGPCSLSLCGIFARIWPASKNCKPKNTGGSPTNCGYLPHGCFSIFVCINQSAMDSGRTHFDWVLVGNELNSSTRFWSGCY